MIDTSVSVGSRAYMQDEHRKGISVYAVPGIRWISLQRRIEDLFGLAENMLFAKTRKIEVVMARHMYISLCYRHVCNSPSRLVRAMPGGYHHAIVYHSDETCSNLCDTDRLYRAKYDRVEFELVNGLIDKPKM